MTTFETQQITHTKASEWERQEWNVNCYLIDGETTKPVKIVYETFQKIVDLKSIDTGGIPRESFDDIATDLKEFLKGYEDFRGLFDVKMQ